MSEDELGPITEAGIRMHSIDLSARDVVGMFRNLEAPSRRAADALAKLAQVLQEMSRRAGARAFRNSPPLCIDGHAYRRRVKRRVKHR